jgi:hypothetical protein
MSWLTKNGRRGSQEPSLDIDTYLDPQEPCVDFGIYFLKVGIRRNYPLFQDHDSLDKPSECGCPFQVANVRLEGAPVA